MPKEEYEDKKDKRLVEKNPHRYDEDMSLAYPFDTTKDTPLGGEGTLDPGLDRPGLANIYGSLPQGLNGPFAAAANQGNIPDRTNAAQRVNLTMPPVNITAPRTISMPPVNITAPPVAEQQPKTITTPPVESTAPPFYGPGSKSGSLTATPQQAQAEELNRLERAKELTGQEGSIQQQRANAEAKIAADREAEANQFKLDYSNMLTSNATRYDAAHKQTQAAYQKYRESAGSLKDPTAQFWADQTNPLAGVLSVFAAGLSGFGAAMTGKGGNPFLEYLNHRMDANFEAHKQNIRDLYDEAVSAGKIEDNVQNQNTFMQNAKLQSRILDSEHVKAELDNVAAQSASKVVPIAVERTKLGIDKDITDEKARLATLQAQQAAATLAQQRAQQKEVRDRFEKALELHNKDMGEDEARQAAFKDVAGLPGVNKSTLGGLAANLGIGYDSNKGEWKYPEKKEQTQVSGPTFDEKGNIVVPNIGTNGKKLTSEEIDKAKDAARERAVIVDGKPAFAINKEAAKAFREFNEAEPQAQRLTKQLNDAWASGDKGAYEQARHGLIELAPKLYGFTRGPSGAQAGEGAREGAGEAGTISGQIPEWDDKTGSQELAKEKHAIAERQDSILGGQFSHGLGPNSVSGIGVSKLKGWNTQLQNLHDDIRKSTFPADQNTNENKKPQESQKDVEKRVGAIPQQ